ncbi:hypothetical protein MSAN_01494100 [Mycena sanguinolenta]|uniref:Uncharacterized protein n=1 Tax=Mycena sanguinolenta TaxID=230812 RepID=A0A8H6YC60_9AGAR|nr:hypothetical protein MSAN_01494100 [Mycena sanguinolenta]
MNHITECHMTRTVTVWSQNSVISHQRLTMRAQPNEKLTLGYMRANQPFDILPEEYFACAMPNNANPPMFLYGFAFPLDGSISASFEKLRAMQDQIPPEYIQDKYQTIDAICRYVESQVDANFEFRIRRSSVDYKPNTLFVFYICTSWMPREPKTPKWVPVLARGGG